MLSLLNYSAEHLQISLCLPPSKGKTSLHEIWLHREHMACFVTIVLSDYLCGHVTHMT